MTSRLVSAQTPYPPTRNRLLGALPRKDLARLLPVLEAVELRLGAVLHEPGQPLDHLYFPLDCIVSHLGVLKNGETAELSLVGREGAVGVELFLGGKTTPTRAKLQSAGTSLRLSVRACRREFDHGGPFERVLLRYAQAVLAQTSQTALCNRFHNVDRQLARWLLLSLDRVDSNQLRMTQKLIADMLGVRREGVAHAAKQMQRRGWIAYSRGTITVLNRAALEAHVCECYEAVKAEYRRLIG